MTPEEAVERLLEALPEFGPGYEQSAGRPSEPGDVLLLHVVTGDLARFHMRHGLGNSELAARFWHVVEELAAQATMLSKRGLRVAHSGVPPMIFARRPGLYAEYRLTGG